MSEQLSRGLPPIDDEYQGPSWWHFSRLLDAGKNPGMRRIAVLGAAVLAISLATGILNVTLAWNGSRSQTMTYLAIPHTLEIPQLLLAQPGTVPFPITVWNHGPSQPIDLEVAVHPDADPSNPALAKTIRLDGRHRRADREDF